MTPGTYQKITGSRAIGKHLNIDETKNASHSYRVFIQGIKRICHLNTDIIHAKG